MSSFPRTQLEPGDSRYPKKLEQFYDRDRFPTIQAIGNLDNLQLNPLAFFCSAQCPGNLILQSYDLAQQLRETGVTVISGFHTPMEQEVLDLLLRGTQPIIYCPARNIDKMRLKPPLKTALTHNRLLILSPFPTSQSRITAELAQLRNQFVVALAEAVFIVHANPGSRTAEIAHKAIDCGKSLFTLDSPDNLALLNLGAKLIQPESVAHLLTVLVDK